MMKDKEEDENSPQLEFYSNDNLGVVIVNNVPNI